MKLTPDLRRFLGWDAPALPVAAAMLADAYARGEAVDLANVAVVLPGGRAGRRLKELLVAEAERRRLRLVPPLVTTVGSLPELLYAPAATVAEEQLCRRVWLHVLRALDGTARLRLFPRPPQADDLQGWLAAAGVVGRLHREVAAAGRRFEDVAAACADMPLHDDHGRWDVLAQLQQSYAQELARLGFADRDLERIAACERCAVASERDLWLVGVAEMPNVVRALLRRLPAPARVRVLVHAPAELGDAFDDLGCVRPAAWLEAEVPLADAQLEIVGHPSNQAAAAAQALAGLGGAFAADEIVIGVPDGEVVPYLERRLASAGVPARYAAGESLARSSAFRLLETLADVLHDRSYDAVAALARHPAFGAWLRRRRWEVPHAGAAAFRESDGWLVRLDRYRAVRLPVSVDDALAGEEDRDRGVVEALRASLLEDALLGAYRGTRRLGEWAPRVLELVLELYGDGARSRDVPEERRLLGLAQALRNVAASHASVPAELDPECDVATAIRVLLDDVRGETLPPAADEAAIELLGWLELHLDDAPVAVLTGMNEGRVPESVNADAFLPNALRARLGCEDNDRRYARDAYQLTAMLHTRRVHAVAGRRSLRGDPLRPSRLLLASSGDALARRIRTFLSEDEDSARVVRGAVPGDVSAFRLPPEPVLSLPEVPERLRATEFGSLLSDPYGWALERVIGDVVEDGASELDPLVFGGLAHAVLEAFGRSGVRNACDPVVIGDFLEATLDALAAQTYGRALPAVRLQVEQLRMRLRSFACAQATWAQDGWRIVGVECSAPEGVPLDVDGTPIRVRGRIDRIDYHAASGAWAVFDYKTGERGEGPDAVHRTKGQWQDLQLPLYRFMLPYVAGEDGQRVFTGGPAATVRLGYILLCGDPAQVRFEVADWTDDDLAGALEAAGDAVRTLRTNRFTFPGLESGWYDDDIAALLGRGRLVPEEDEELEQEVGA